MRPKRKQNQKPLAPVLPLPPELNPALAGAVLAAVDKQLASGQPAETRQAFERLIERGYSPEGARQLIGHIVVREVFAVMANGEVYDASRFLAALAQLPDLPTESS